MIPHPPPSEIVTIRDSSTGLKSLIISHFTGRLMGPIGRGGVLLAGSLGMVTPSTRTTMATGRGPTSRYSFFPLPRVPRVPELQNLKSRISDFSIFLKPVEDFQKK